MVSTLVLIYFDRPSLGHTMKTNCTTFEAIDPETGSILIFYKSVWDYLPHHILCMIFQDNYYSCCFLITDQILLSNCFYFLRALLEIPVVSRTENEIGLILKKLVWRTWGIKSYYAIRQWGKPFFLFTLKFLQVTWVWIRASLFHVTDGD